MLYQPHDNKRPNVIKDVPNFIQPTASQFLLNSKRREIQAGLVFSETYKDNYSVARNGGECNGACTIDEGATLDGTSGYVLSTMSSGTTNVDKISFFVEFNPDFNWDEATTRVLYDCSGARYAVIKLPTAIRILMNNTTIADIPSTSYSSIWKQNGVNRIVVAGVTGDTSVWMNGTKILSSSATAWAKGNTTKLYTGSIQSVGLFFDGKITKLQIYQKQLTDRGAEELCAYGTFKNSPDLVTNGGFETDLTGWTPQFSTVATWVSGGKAKIEHGGTNDPGLAQLGTLVAGTTYTAIIECGSDGNALPQLYDGSVVWTGTTDAAQKQRITFTAASNNLYIKGITSTLGEYVLWDKITIEAALTTD